MPREHAQRCVLQRRNAELAGDRVHSRAYGEFKLLDKVRGARRQYEMGLIGGGHY
jgi:hypothetical protein